MGQGIEKSLGYEIRDDLHNLRAELEVVKIELFSKLLLLIRADKKSRVKYPDYRSSKISSLFQYAVD